MFINIRNPQPGGWSAPKDKIKQRTHRYEGTLMIDEMDLGMVSMHLLYHGSQERVTTPDMTDELDSHGYEYDRDEIERGLRNLVAKGLMETDEQQY
ncbi:MAG: hypothetical protein SVU32_05840, partial [Candidatus Nanohaloarchaea archaeon]|nr:hypothetical protein [Candidatus Nanohaloarchaea archaeon]